MHELTGEGRIIFNELGFPRVDQQRLPVPCLDRFINGVYLGDLARVLGSSWSAYL